MPHILMIFLFSICSFILLFIIAKLLGKKQIAELDFIDYVVGISLGSIAAEWATDFDKPWYYYVTAMLIFFVLDISITLLSRTVPFLKKGLQGSPLLIMADGEFVYSNLRKTKMSINDVLGLARSKGYFDLSSIAFIVLETNGELSILPNADQRPVVASDVPTALMETVSIPDFVVVDGRIYDEALAQLGKNHEWVMSSLKINEDSLKNILLASYDSAHDTFRTYYKTSENATLKIK